MKSVSKRFSGSRQTRLCFSMAYAASFFKCFTTVCHCFLYSRAGTASARPTAEYTGPTSDGQPSTTIWSISFIKYFKPVRWSDGLPRRSRSGPMQAHTEPHIRLCRSSSFLTNFGSMCEGSSIGISTDSKPHRLNCGKSFVLALVNGDVNRKVLMPNLIMVSARLINLPAMSKAFLRDPNAVLWHLHRVTESEAIKLLEHFRAGGISRDKVLHAFQSAPVVDLGFAQVD